MISNEQIWKTNDPLSGMDGEMNTEYCADHGLNSSPKRKSNRSENVLHVCLQINEEQCGGINAE